MQPNNGIFIATDPRIESLSEHNQANAQVSFYQPIVEIQDTTTFQSGKRLMYLLYDDK